MTREELNKACEWIDSHLHLFIMSGSRQIHYPALLQEFRKAMGAVTKESLTTELKKKMIIEWDDKGSVDISVPDGEAKTVEVVGVLEMCKLVLFENKQQKED